MPSDMSKVTPDGKWPDWVQKKVTDYHDSHQSDPICILLKDREPQVSVGRLFQHRSTVNLTAFCRLLYHILTIIHGTLRYMFL